MRDEGLDKHQMLSTKLQTSTKSQALSTKRLEFEVWNLSFVCNLEFEIYEG